jgi:hypothetical protein
MLASRRPVMVWLKYGLLAVAIFSTVINIHLIVKSFTHPYVYQKDIIQEYLLARASQANSDPYLPLPELASIYLGEIPVPILTHPTPHPPPVVLLSYPFGLIRYELATIIWFALEMVCISGSIYLLLKWQGVGNIWVKTIIFSILSLGWEPLMVEVVNGQLETILLIIFIGVWLSLVNRKYILGGVLLGILISIKLIGWPILIFYALRKKWQFVFSVFITTIGANIISGAVMGFDYLLKYYLEVSQLVVSLYRGFFANFSLFTIGWRVFYGTGSSVRIGIEAPPLYFSEIAARITSIFIPFMFLVLCLWMAFRNKHLDLVFIILISTSLLVNPIVWHHYLIIAVFPLILLFRFLWDHQHSKSEFIVSVLVILLLFASRVQIRDLVYLLGGELPGSNVSVQVSFWTSLITLEPILPLLGMIWLSIRLNDRHVSQPVSP